jgi:hypothetical protein
MTMIRADRNELARTEAIDFARRLVRHWQETLGAELLGAYLIGSLAHAGFNWRYSDIDLAIVTEAGSSQDALDGLKSEAMAQSSDWPPCPRGQRRLHTARHESQLSEFFRELGPQIASA